MAAYVTLRASWVQHKLLHGPANGFLTSNYTFQMAQNTPDMLACEINSYIFVIYLKIMTWWDLNKYQSNISSFSRQFETQNFTMIYKTNPQIKCWLPCAKARTSDSNIKDPREHLVAKQNFESYCYYRPSGSILLAASVSFRNKVEVVFISTVC